MNREIKFRGMHIHAMPCNNKLNGTWVHGYLASKSYINPGNGEEFEALVDESTIGQYTGFKDKNGKEIYEGDILGGDYWVNNVAGSVEFSECLGAWLLEYKGGGDELLCKVSSKSEVVGNIYENPELLAQQV